MIYLRRGWLLWSKQNLYSDVCDPTRLTVGGGNCLETPSPHQKQVQRLFLVERLPPAQPQRRFSLLRVPCGKLPNAAARGNAVGVLLIIKFEVSLGAITELVANQ